jgi:GNAT superfamily N-acetyltransferase
VNAAAVDVVVAEPAHEAGLARLFASSATGPCHCRFWHFEGDNNAWLERLAFAPDENRRAFAEALRAGADEARGVVAVARDGGDVVGWVKVAPAHVMGKLYGRRLYRGLPCFAGDRDGVHTVGCLLVDPAWRRRGVASALVGGAVRLAPSFGARALEAFPRVPREPVSDEELFTGPSSVFAEHGFEVVNAFEPYPVLRRAL